MPAQIANVRLVDLEGSAKLGEPLAQPRPFALPAADADVDVVTLRKDPGVAARNHAELDGCPPAEALPRDVRIADVAFERDAKLERLRTERAGRDPIRPVGADHDVRFEALAANRDRARGVDFGHLHAVAKLGARGRRPLGEECVEPAALRHQHERPLGAAAPASPVAQPELERVDAVFDHGLDRERQFPHRAQRQPAAARLVAREPRTV